MITRRSRGTPAPPTKLLSTLSSTPRGGSISSNNTFKTFVSKNFFILGMMTSLATAYLLPTLFNDASPLNPKFVIGNFGVPTIFLLASLGLPTSELSRSIRSPLNLPIQFLSLILIPSLNLVLSRTLFPLYLPPPYVSGLLLLSALPTTVNMCIALTTNAGGNVATAVTNAVLGNLLGILSTPMWFSIMMKSSSGANISFLKTLTGLLKKVLLPMVLGQFLRLTPALKFYSSRKKLAKLASESILLSIVLNSFSNAFSTSTTLTVSTTLTLAATTVTLHLLYFATSFKVFGALGVDRKNVIAYSFVSSHKTLAFGLPLIRQVFANDPNLAALVAPLMLIHPLQLFVGGAMKEKLLAYAEEDG